MALTWNDIDSEFITVKHSWAKKDKLKCTKNGRQRIIPLPQEIKEELLSLKPQEALGNDLIFESNVVKGQPIESDTVRVSLYSALERIGISAKERKERNIVFHSWRHYAAVWMRINAGDQATRLITGHIDPTMLDHYTNHVTATTTEAIRRAQKHLVPA